MADAQLMTHTIPEAAIKAAKAVVQAMTAGEVEAGSRQRSMVISTGSR